MPDTTDTRKTGPPAFKELSFSFRAECIHDVVGAMNRIFCNEEALKMLCGYSVKRDDMFPDVGVVVVFRAYEACIDEAVGVIKTVLTLIGEDDAHVINETINYTDEYDGERTYTGEQRPALRARIEEKLCCVIKLF